MPPQDTASKMDWTQLLQGSEKVKARGKRIFVIGLVGIVVTLMLIMNIVAKGSSGNSSDFGFYLTTKLLTISLTIMGVGAAAQLWCAITRLFALLGIEVQSLRELIQKRSPGP